MRFVIKYDDLIVDIQRKFSEIYPFLRIEFTFSGKPVGRASDNNTMFIGNGKASALQISDAMTVADLQNELYAKFNVLCQVFRKSGNLWLETKMTDKWTLKHQNDHGAEISASYE